MSTADDPARSSHPAPTTPLGRPPPACSYPPVIPPNLTPPSRPKADDPALRAALMALVEFGVRLAHVVTETAEAEACIVAAMASNLPAAKPARSMYEAQHAGHTIDAADAALAQASPRITAAGQTYERVSRAIRRTVALVERIDHGWTPRGGSDNRRAMARRHIARAVGERITRHSDGEAAERLFDDLVERLDAMEADGDLDRPVDGLPVDELPIDELIEAICQGLGLPAEPQPRTPPADAPAAPGNAGADPPDG